MRMDHLAPLFRSAIGFDRPFHLVEDRPGRPSARHPRQGLRWINAIHRRWHDDDDDPPTAPAAMRLPAPDPGEAHGEAHGKPGAAMLLAA